MIILDQIIKAICICVQQLQNVAPFQMYKYWRFSSWTSKITKKKSSAIKFYCGLQDCNSKESYCLYQTNAARMKYTVKFRPKDIGEKNAVEKPEKCLVENNQSESTDRNREQDVLISEKLINNEMVKYRQIQ